MIVLDLMLPVIDGFEVLRRIRADPMLVHVPVVVYFPQKWQHLAPKEYRAGGKSDRMVSFVDLAPTVLSIVGIRPPAWMQGHAFAGPFQTEPQPYLFGARGRMDERIDNVRSVTDGRYVYLRNYFPHVSQAQRVSYQFETPTTRIWRDLFDQGKTNEAQSLFWRTPKAPEELYDLQNDRDEVRNLANSAEHRAILEKLRAAQQAHLIAIRDVTLLPEVEMHARAHGTSPYDMARAPGKYPMEKVMAAADLASRLEASALPQLETFLNDADSAVRYWAAAGFLMRGQAGITRGAAGLRRALKDSSIDVRIVAAQALAEHGTPADLAASLDVLRELAPPEKNGILVSMSALSAIEAIGEKGKPLHDLVRTMSPNGPSPHNRFDSYVPRLMANIAPPPPGTAPAAKANRAKKKAAKQQE